MATGAARAAPPDGKLVAMGDHASKTPRRLIIFPGALGDLICAAPAMRWLASRAPGVETELMARAELARFAVGRLGFVHGHSLDRREVGHLFVSERISPEARAFFGGFAEVHSFFASADPAFRASLTATTGGRADCYPFRPEGAGHITRRYLDAVGAPPEAPAETSLEPYSEDLDAADDRLESVGLARGEFVAIFPGSGAAAKNWPAANFVAIAERLVAPLRPLIILGPAENALEPIFAARRLPLLCNLELAEVAAIMRRAAGFVGNDSGVSHLAAAAGAPGLAIFGPTDPERWRPRGRVAIIRREPLAMTTVVEVMDILLRVIAGDGSTRSADG